MHSITNTCFVCNKPFEPKEKKEINQTIMLPVCQKCKGTDKEKSKAQEALDSLADGFVCGCI